MKISATPYILLLTAVLFTVLLQLAVIYVPFLQFTFETYPVQPPELIASVLIAALMLFMVEAEKWVTSRVQAQRAA